MSARTVVFALVGGLLLDAPAGAQMPRDAPAASVSTTASLVGTVVEDAPAGGPIRRALVTARSAAGSGAEQQTVTDDEGRFRFVGLAPGAYIVEFARPGFVSSAYGARTWSAPGTPVAIGSGQSVTIAARLQRGAVIAGVTRGCGGWAGNGRAQAFRIATVSGERRLVPTGPNVVIDERGAYRLWGLPPGEYIVQSAPFTISGAETRLTMPAEVTWASQVTQPSVTAVAPGTPTGRAGPPQGPPVAVAACYFPGTADETTAQPIRLAAGEERTGVDFDMDFVPAAVVSGVVIGPNGSPVAAPRLSWIRRTPLQAPLASAGVRVESEGRFVIPRISPGQYVLFAASGAAAGGEPETMGFASMELSIHGRDISDLVVRLQPGVTISGRVAFTGGPPSASALDVSVRLVTVGMSGIGGTPPTAPVGSDGTFVLRDVAPGRYRLNATVTGAPGWTMQSAILAGVESLDAPVELRVGQDIDDALVTFGNAPTQLSGALVDALGQPAPGYALVAFSTDRTHWQSSSRRVHLAKAATNGTYTFDLPPGEYYLAAAAELTTEQISDAAILEALAGASLRVTLQRGEKKVQNLRVGGQ